MKPTLENLLNPVDDREGLKNFLPLLLAIESSQPLTEHRQDHDQEREKYLICSSLCSLSNDILPKFTNPLQFLQPFSVLVPPKTINLNPHQPTNQQFEDYNASLSPSSFSSSSSPLSSPVSSPIHSPSSPGLSLNSNSSENFSEPFPLLSTSNSDDPLPINQNFYTTSDLLYSIPSTTTNQPPQVPKQKPIRGSSSIKKTNESPSNQNFNLFVGTHQISVVVLRHQGINGRHPSESKKFYYQARVRNEYPQRHLWSGWASKQEVIDKIQKMFEDEECQLTQVTPTQNPAKRPPKVKNDSGQNEKPSSERNSIRLQRKRDYEMKEDSPQRQKSVRLDDGDDYEPNIRSKPKSKPKLKNVKPQTFSNPQQQHSIQEADTGLWNRTNLPVEYS